MPISEKVCKYSVMQIVLSNLSMSSVIDYQTIMKETLAPTWTNVDLSSKVFCSIQLRAISQERLNISIPHISFKMTNSQLQLQLLETNEVFIMSRNLAECVAAPLLDVVVQFKANIMMLLCFPLYACSNKTTNIDQTEQSSLNALCQIA